jgi:50S ribosomal protein L16 3-hydroxylase
MKHTKTKPKPKTKIKTKLKANDHAAIHDPRTLLGGISPAQFMAEYWEKKPLLIRGALPGLVPPVPLTQLKRLSRRDDVESRLIWRENEEWCMEQGPFDHLPRAIEKEWTLLVQGVDLHDDVASDLLHQFNFVPAARLDDLMISYATDGGGVGPHVDSYDVFLIQAYGNRRWRYGAQKDLSLVPDLPLKILANFTPEFDEVLEPGDMLYLPPHLAHDGVAVGNCMTLSVGFRAPDAATLARGMLEAASDQIAARSGAGQSAFASPPLPGPSLKKRFKDPKQSAVTEPSALPKKLIDATCDSVKKLKFDRKLAKRYLGCWLTEPHPLAVFKPTKHRAKLPHALKDMAQGYWRLDRRTRMLYNGKVLYINGEVASLKAKKLLRTLANNRSLDSNTLKSSPEAEDILDYLNEWTRDGWLHWQPT